MRSRAASSRPRSSGHGDRDPWTRRRAAIALFLALAASLLACATLQDRPSAPPHALILVGIDGCRHDFLERADTPALDRLAADGVAAERLLPAFPTKTFPNHYTMVTGLYPEHHGIVANSFYDPVFDATYSLGDRTTVEDGRWYGGEPIWVTLERQGGTAATFSWPGSEAEIAGRRPTFWRIYDAEVPNADRVDQVLAWLDLPPRRRPGFVTLYFSDVDDAAHRNDPDTAPEVGQAVARIDAIVGRLVDGLEHRGLLASTDIIVVSDHGMAATSPERAIAIDDYVDLELANVVDWNPVLALWPAAERVEEVYAALAGAHPHLAVYRKSEIPEALHYRQHRRIPPLLGIADEGWSVTSRSYLQERGERLRGGNHGYDNRLASMGAIFIASGPSFRRGSRVPALENIHLYELMAAALGVEPAPNDGDLAAVRHLLAVPPDR